MVLDKLSSSLKDTLKRIARALFVDERLVNELIKEIQKALLYADVNVQLVFELTEKIKKRALEEKSPKILSKKEHLINIVYEELVKFLGEEKREIKTTGKKPFKIMLVGLFGNGKTTSAGKLAKFYQKRGIKVALIQLDVYRPASLEQLKTLGKSLNVDVFGIKEEKDPLKIYKNFEDEFKNYDLLIIDTAGRDALSKDLILEIEKLNKYIKPDERLLVIGGDIGQGALKQAEQFNKSCDITGVVVTKLDGTAKGGGALSACAASNAFVKFIGVGEKINDLEEFNPKGFVGRLLGMGDLEALLEKAKEAISMEEAEDMSKKLLKGDFNLIDLHEQMSAMKKMGSLSKIFDMIPGIGGLKIPKELLTTQEGKIDKWKFIMQSCTKEELENPEIITTSRIDRISKGSGMSTSEIRELLKQYKQSKKVMKLMKGNQDPNKILKKFKGKLPKGFKVH